MPETPKREPNPFEEAALEIHKAPVWLIQVQKPMQLMQSRQPQGLFGPLLTYALTWWLTSEMRNAVRITK